MSAKLISGLLLAIFQLTVYSFNTWAADLSTQPAYSQNSDIDVLKYEVDLIAGKIDGSPIQMTEIISLKTLKQSFNIQFHLEPKFIRVESIEDENGNNLSYLIKSGFKNDFNLTGSFIDIRLKKKKNKNELLKLKIRYSVLPQLFKQSEESFENVKENPGMYYSTDFNGTPVLTTHNWPYYARYWLISNDHPSDVAQFLFNIHVAKNMMAVANGSLVDGDYQKGTATDKNGLKVYRWNLNDNIATYNIQLAIGQFETFSRRLNLQGSKKQISQVFFSPPNLKDKNQFLEQVNKSGDAVEYFDLNFESYLYGKLGYINIPHPFNMESVSLITVIDSTAGVHEAMHQWWGNSVHFADWGDLWISEGFTVYFTALYEEHLTQKPAVADAFTCGTDDPAVFTDGILNQPDGIDPLAFFSSTPYCKGFAALKDLRQRIDKVTETTQLELSHKQILTVFKGIYERNYKKGLTTKMLFQDLSEHLSKDLKLDQLKSLQLNQELLDWKQTWFQKF